MSSFDDLKAKYKAVLDKGPEVGLSVQNLHLEGDKLLVRGIVPTDFAKNTLWDAIKIIDANVPDAIFDLNVQAGMTYQVVSGDTLSKIAKRFYGDPNAYHQIFEANRDQLTDPDKIRVGQTLKLS